MRVVHEPANGGERSVLATDVDTADSTGEQAKGLMFRDDVPEDYALVFRFDDPPGWLPAGLTNWRSIHMLFVKVPLDVVWLVNGEVRKVKTARPWVGLGLGRADTLLEMPAGAADGVEVGDTVLVEGDGSDE